MSCAAATSVGNCSELVAIILEKVVEGVKLESTQDWLATTCLVNKLWRPHAQRMLWEKVSFFYGKGVQSLIPDLLDEYQHLAGYVRSLQLRDATEEAEDEIPGTGQLVALVKAHNLHRLPQLRKLRIEICDPYGSWSDWLLPSSLRELRVDQASMSIFRASIQICCLERLHLSGLVAEDPDLRVDLLKTRHLEVLLVVFWKPDNLEESLANYEEEDSMQTAFLRWCLDTWRFSLRHLDTMHLSSEAVSNLDFRTSFLKHLAFGGYGSINWTLSRDFPFERLLFGGESLCLGFFEDWTVDELSALQTRLIEESFSELKELLFVLGGNSLAYNLVRLFDILEDTCVERSINLLVRTATLGIPDVLLSSWPEADAYLVQYTDIWNGVEIPGTSEERKAALLLATTELEPEE